MAFKVSSAQIEKVPKLKKGVFFKSHFYSTYKFDKKNNVRF